MRGREAVYNAAVVSSGSSWLALLMPRLCVPCRLLEFSLSLLSSSCVADYMMRIVKHVDLLCFS